METESTPETTPETTDTTPSTPTPDAPDDSGVWDMERGMRTLTHMRAQEKSHKATIVQLRGAVTAMAAGRDLPEGLAAAMGTPASVAPTAELEAYKAAFESISGALGVAYDGKDTKPLLDAARASRLSAEVGRAIQARGMDDRTSRAMVDLSSVDLNAGGDAIKVAVAEAVDKAAFESPNLRLRTQTAIVSGAPMGPSAGQGGMPSMVSRSQLKFMSPSEIQQAVRSGLVDMADGANR